MPCSAVAYSARAQRRRDHSVTTAPATQNDTEEICDAVIVEFKLSKREGEILKLVARGYTVDNISNKLVISPYTTQTHIRHIYAKMNIHKRSELLDYINMHRDSEKPVRPAAKAEKK